MDLRKNWFKRWRKPKDPRKAERLMQPRLVAHYWTGAPPAARGIRDISSTGMYLVTEERWYPGTLVKVTLQRTDGAEDDSERSIHVLATVVRCGADGVGFAFVLPTNRDSDAEISQLDAVTDRKVLERFMDRLGTNDNKLIVNVV